MAQNVNGNGRNKGPEPSEADDAALRARLSQLSQALDQRRDSSPSEDRAGGSGSSWGTATNLGFQALIEFVTAVVVGPIIGWQIDSWLKTQPIFFIIFLILGMVAGLMNVYRMAVRPTGGKRDQHGRTGSDAGH